MLYVSSVLITKMGLQTFVLVGGESVLLFVCPFRCQATRDRCVHTSAANLGLREFFDTKDNWGASEVRVGKCVWISLADAVRLCCHCRGQHHPTPGQVNLLLQF